MSLNISERMKHYKVPGISITLIEKEKIKTVEHYGILEAGSNRKVNNHSIYGACSISKLLTSLLVMKLTELGLLELDEDVNKRLKSWKVADNEFTENKKVTLRNLLSHQSGMIDPEGSFSELVPKIGIPTMAELLDGNTPYCTSPIEVKYEPESEFHYSDSGFCIIQQLIEDVTNKDYHQVINELIFEPLKMKNSFIDRNISKALDEKFSCGHNKNGEVVDGKYPIYPYPAASGLWTTSSDLAQLVIELMNALKGNSKLGISAEKAKEMIIAHGNKAWTGLGLFLNSSGSELEITSLGWGVGFQCMMVAFPFSEKGAVIMTNAELGVHQMDGIIGEIYKSFMSDNGN